MSKSPLTIITAIAGLVWLGVLINIALPFPAPWDKVLRWFGLGLLIIHSLELLMFRSLLGASGNPKWLDSLLIIVSGAFHASYLARQRAQRSKAGL
ncbi:MAG: DUF1145 domain-containing protein [Pseudomonadota bacterium]